jgi:hypothetical protein
MPVSIWKVPLMSEIFNRKVPCPISRVANVANEKKKGVWRIEEMVGYNRMLKYEL